MRPAMDAFFLPRGPYRLLCVLHAPADPDRCRGAILHVPALAEEMNKSRRAVAQAARALAESGWFVLTIDPAGTGDSSGEFHDVSWADWVADVRAAWHWLADRAGMPPLLWGLRAGCLLIDEALRDLPCERVLYWQPSLSGDAVLTQFLRLRTAAGATKGGGVKETPKTLVAALEGGETIEVAGYALAPPLALPLRAARLGGADAGRAYAGKRVDWIEVSASEPAALLPASEARIADLREAGATVEARVVPGVGFWMTQEIDEASGLVAATVAALCALTPGPSPASGRGGARPSDTLAPRPAPARERGWGGEKACNDVAPGIRERPIPFGCDGETLLGIVSLPPAPRDIGVLIVVGGPQTRVGSHRMFTLLARELARQGVAAFRFDCRGMGDSSGRMRTFEELEEDIGCAIAAFRAAVPEVDRVVPWGLCDAASAILMGVGQWNAIAGLVLANPWARSEASHNRTIVRHYYANRLLQREFWVKLATGGLPIVRVAREFAARLAGSAGRGGRPAATSRAHFRDRMRAGWQAFPGSRLLILSGQDLTAREFEDHAGSDPRWSLSRPDTVLVRLEHADHTFSGARDYASVFQTTCDFLSDLAHHD